MRSAVWALSLVGCWPLILEPDPREDVPLEADADVDADSDADADADTDSDGDVDVECPPIDHDLGSAVGPNVASGNTCVGGDDYAKGCGGVPGPDVAFAWTAPEEGTYQIDLIGSDYDTVLTIFSACPELTELECNDDFQLNTHSGIQRDFVAGQPVVIVVEGFNVMCGNFQVNITLLGAVELTPEDTAVP